jgi:hypothetical protein
MMSEWIKQKLDPLVGEPLIILKDPQRLIRRGDFIVHGWGESNGYAVLYCTGNLGLRTLLQETSVQNPQARVLLVDRSRSDAKRPLFYPDLWARSRSHARLQLTLRDYLMETTQDSHWPLLVNTDRQISALIIENLEAVIAAYHQLRAADLNRFTDSDLYKILLGAVLEINPFQNLSPAEVRRLCIERHNELDELRKWLPADVMDQLEVAIHGAPKPFCWLLERDPEQVMLAFLLAAVMHQHGLDYQLLLANLDPQLHAYREIDPHQLEVALKDLSTSNADLLQHDTQFLEKYLIDNPTICRELLFNQLHLADATIAEKALNKEKLIPLIRNVASITLLMNLIQQRDIKFHRKVLSAIELQENDPTFLASLRPGEKWHDLVLTYQRAISVFELTAKLKKAHEKVQTGKPEDLNFEYFNNIWNQQGLNCLDFFLADLNRLLRVGDMLPLPMQDLWPEIKQPWEETRALFQKICGVAEKTQRQINKEFQQLYQKQYALWIQDQNAPAVFTHQFLGRVLKANWDPQSNKKAVILVFDGLRTDAWQQLLKPVLEERFEISAEYPGSALIPTETELSRKAIAAGKLPAQFSGQNSRELELLKAWLKDNLRISPQFEVVCDDDTVASGMTMRYVSKNLEYIVFKFCDDNLHNNKQDLAFIYNSILNQIVQQDVRSVIRNLPEDILLFITSDHGFTPMPSETILISEDMVNDEHDIKYRNARVISPLTADVANNVCVFKMKDIGVDQPNYARGGQATSLMIFPHPDYLFKRFKGRHSPDNYSHGGLSLAECMIPMVVLSNRRKDQGELRIAELKLEGSAREGETIQIHIAVISSKLFTEKTMISLSFSQLDILARREIFSGQQKTFKVNWQPSFDDIDPEIRLKGEVTIPITVTLSYKQGMHTIKSSRTLDARIQLDDARLQRRLDTKLDLMMGKKG